MFTIAKLPSISCWYY